MSLDAARRRATLRAMWRNRLGLFALMLVAFALGACTMCPSYRNPGGSWAQSSDHVRIHYRTAGSGEPTIVFVHGWCCNKLHFDDAMERLAPRHRVVALDLAGHGESDSNRRAWTIDAFAQDVKAVVDRLHLGPNERVVLVGHSMGAPVALAAAQLLPGKVAGVIAVDALHDVDRKLSEAEIDVMIAPYRQHFLETTDQLVRKFFFEPGSDPKLVDEVARSLAAANPEVAVPIMEQMFRWNIAELVEAAHVPVHCINASSTPTNVEHGRAHAPRFDVDLVEGVGHFVMLEAPDRFADLVESAITSFEASP